MAEPSTPSHPKSIMAGRPWIGPSVHAAPLMLGFRSKAFISLFNLFMLSCVSGDQIFRSQSQKFSVSGSPHFAKTSFSQQNVRLQIQRHCSNCRRQWSWIGKLKNRLEKLCCQDCSILLRCFVKLEGVSFPMCFLSLCDM